MVVSSSQPPGPGVDAQGRAVIDPTENVKALNEAATKRQDDLREYEAKHIREILNLRAAYDEKLADLRQSNAEKVQRAESKRLDEVRQVDQARLTADAAAAEIRATALQSQVALSADAVRNAASAAAQAQTENLTRVIAPLQGSIEDLRRTQYQQQGEKTQVHESRSGSALNVNYLMAFIAIITVLVLITALYLSQQRSKTVQTTVPGPTVTVSATR